MKTQRAIQLLVVVSVAGVVQGAAVAGQDGKLVIVNQAEHTVLVEDTAKRTVLAKISVGINGHEVAVSPDGRFAYVPIYGDSVLGKPGSDGRVIDVIDLRERKLAGTIDLGKPVRPHCARFGPDGLLYVTAELSDALYVVDPATQRVVAEVFTGAAQSHMFVISPDGRRAYTANVSTGSISVLDLVSHRLLETIAVAKHIQRISISPDGRHVYTHDQDNPRIAVIDTATNRVSNWIPLPAPASTAGQRKILLMNNTAFLARTAFSSAVTPDGKWLVVAAPFGKVYAVNTAAMRVEKSFDVPAWPSEVLITPDGGTAYVSCMTTGEIAVLDLHEWKLKAPIVLTKGVDGLGWLESGK